MMNWTVVPLRPLNKRPGRVFGRKVRHLLTIGSITSYSVVGFAQDASAAITPTYAAPDIANAMAATPGVVTGANFVSVPPAPPAANSPNAIVDSPLAGFPRNGGSFAMLTTGDPNLADDPNTAEDSGADLNGGGMADGPHVRGDTDLDVTILKVDFSVAAEQNCFQIDFKFLSEEFPDPLGYVDYPFNDAFILEIDKSTWNTAAFEINAPDTIARNAFGDIVSVNSIGRASVSPAAAVGTTYDAATEVLIARSPVSPGVHSAYFSIFDQTDQISDSAVFLDNLRLTTEKPGECHAGTIFICTQTGTATNDKLTGTPDNDVLCGEGGKDELIGLEGNDVLLGGTGNDLLIPGRGNDLVLGEVGGDDTVSFAGSPGPINADLGKGTVEGEQGFDELEGVENAVGTFKADKLKGSGARNELKGKKGRDKLAGQNRSDRLIGGAGNDRLDGGPGDDFCLQGPGSGAVLNCESP